MIYFTNLDLSLENKTTLKNKFKNFFNTITIAENIPLPILYKKMYKKDTTINYTNNLTNNDTNNTRLDVNQINDLFKTTIDSTNIEQNSISNEESIMDGKKAYTYTFSLTNNNIVVSLSLTFLTVDNNLIIILYSAFPAKLYIKYYISFRIVLNTLVILNAST